MSSRNSPTLTLDVRARRAERLRGVARARRWPRCARRAARRRAVLDDCSPLAAVARRRVRAVAGRLDRVQASDRRLRWLPMAAGCWPTSRACIPADFRPLARAAMPCGCAGRTAARPAALDAAGRIGDLPAEQLRALVRAPADRGSGAGVARSPDAMRTVRERRHEAAKMCSPRTFRELIRAGGQSIRAAREGAGR